MYPGKNVIINYVTLVEKRSCCPSVFLSKQELNKCQGTNVGHIILAGNVSVKYPNMHLSLLKSCTSKQQFETSTSYRRLKSAFQY